MDDAQTRRLALLAMLWLAYFVLHSLLASLTMKSWVARHFPHRVPAYRLCFNMLSTLTLLPILWLMLRHPGPSLWAWTGAGFWLANGLALAALVGFVRSARYYDTSEFIGLRQWKSATHSIEDQESFRISPFHRHVRHPWYALGLILLWTRDMNAALLLSAVLLTAYLFIGAHLEEQKLIARYGEAYRHYMQRVPGLIPLPWKSLSAEEAAELVAEAERHSGACVTSERYNRRLDR